MLPRVKAGMGLFVSFSLLASPSAAGEGRAFWLTRWNARDAGMVSAALEGMAALRANTLFIQVYGDGMALHRSEVAPRSPLVAAGFDPLDLAVAEGRRRGIEVHAFINILNVWSGGLGTPADPRHLVRAHPEWAVVDATGRSDMDFVGVPDTLIFFCPQWEGLRQYVVALVEEIASRYAVDGIHLDYLRFPVGLPRCFCSEHRRRFSERFGRLPTDGDPDFIEWRFENITGLFGELYDAVGAIDPRLKVSAALVAPTGRYYQDARRILESGKLDIAVPMNYTGDLPLFEERARQFHENSGGRLVYTGIAADLGVVGEESALARRIGLEGQCLFAWGTLDDAGRAALAAAWSAPAAPPPLPWKDGSADLTPPVLSGARAAAVLPLEATILWHSDEKTRGRVEYGPSAALGLAAERPGLYFDHAVRISGLRSAAIYHYRVVSTDPAGNSSRSAVQVFTTPPAGPIEVVVDDGGPGFERSGPWSAGSSAGGNEGDYLFSSDQALETAWARFRPYVPRRGLYEIAVWYVSGANRVQDARYTLVHAEGSRSFLVDQRSGGGAWRALGSFTLEEGDSGYVRLSNQASGGEVVVADAARFRLLRAEALFVRGDATGDGGLDLSDPVAVLFSLFAGREIACPDALDANDDGRLELADAVTLLVHLFGNGPTPAAPYPLPGADPTPDGLADCP